MKEGKLKKYLLDGRIETPVSRNRKIFWIIEVFFVISNQTM